MNQLENCQARYRSNTCIGRTHTDGPDEFEPSKFDCIIIKHVRNGCYAYTVNILKFQTLLSFCSKLLLEMSAGIYKTFVSIANREYPYQKQSDLGLSCLSLHFWQATCN